MVVEKRDRFQLGHFLFKARLIHQSLPSYRTTATELPIKLVNSQFATVGTLTPSMMLDPPLKMLDHPLEREREREKML
jgi:hypothetical protein